MLMGLRRKPQTTHVHTHTAKHSHCHCFWIDAQLTNTHFKSLAWHRLSLISCVFNRFQVHAKGIYTPTMTSQITNGTNGMRYFFLNVTNVDSVHSDKSLLLKHFFFHIQKSTNIYYGTHLFLVEFNESNIHKERRVNKKHVWNSIQNYHFISMLRNSNS